MGNTACKLAALSVYAESDSGSYGDMRISLTHTSATSLSTTFENNYGGNTPTEVFFKSTFELNSTPVGWKQIVFDTAFSYNGTDNLLIEIRWSGGSGIVLTGATVESGWKRTLLGAVDATIGTLQGYRNVLQLAFLNRQLSGTICDRNGVGVADVTLLGLFGNPVSAPDGSYSAMVFDGWSGMVTPASETHIFVPDSRTYAEITEDAWQQNYSALSTAGISKESATATHTDGHIPTDLDFQSLGSLSSSPATITVSIPPDVMILGVDVSYTMTAVNDAYMSEQYSWLRCVSPGGAGETQIARGEGTTEGTYSYSRTGLGIANGVKGGGDITFELHAGRDWGGSGANTDYNRVDGGSLQVTVHHIDICTRPHLEDLQMTPGSIPSMVVRPGFPDHLYTLQYNTNLTASGGWQNVPEQTRIMGYGQPIQMDLIGIENEPSAFYRVLMETAP
jgi:hypothetical protein